MTSKKNKDIDLDLNVILKLFFKYPLNYLCVMKKGEIYSFVSKEKIVRLSAQKDFLENSNGKSLSKLYEDISLDLFFEDIDEKSIKEIPLIDLDIGKIEITQVKYFSPFFRPLKQIEYVELIKTMREFSVSIAIFNTQKEWVFKTKLFSKMHSYISKKNSLKKIITVEMMRDWISQEGEQKKTLNIEGMKIEFYMEAFLVHNIYIFSIRS